jgi:predicted nuclease of restriction endonuclease-like (RecB) superfamily
VGYGIEINDMNFDDLIIAISNTHNVLGKKANNTINTCTTLRNWLIGAYVQEYEQKGEDRAQYGAGLLEKLSNDLKRKGISGCSARNIWLFRQFYQIYPLILQAVPAEFKDLLGQNILSPILQAAPAESKTAQSVTGLDVATLLSNLSFTHFVELLKIKDPLKRVFYELECIKCGWSTRELNRQIGSLYYERVGLSKNKEKLIKLVRNQKLPEQPDDIIRDPYVFEFLGLKPHEVMYENNLRDALVAKLQNFILELGKGFCFEARNKRVIIGEKYYFIDLVFYHKILKASILLELKLRPFKHGDMAQLNTYLNYYKKNEMVTGDKSPIGILLCTEKDHPLVEYALAGIDNQLFVSEYSLQLPSKEEIGKFLAQAIQKEKGC